MPSTAQSVPVTADNFVRAETDRYFGVIRNQGGFGKIFHRREPMPVDKQTVIRANRDTLYSSGVFDLDAGHLTVVLPDAGKRYRAMLVVTEDHYMPMVHHNAGAYTFSRSDFDTRYIALEFRTLIDPDDPADIRKAHLLQDAITVSQPTDAGRLEVPDWDQGSLKTVRDALLVLNATLPDLRHASGLKDRVDPVRHLIATASAWGLNPDDEAIYLNITLRQNDGKTAYRLRVRDVPVDGFWSVIVYNAEGYIPENSRNIYSFNNITAKKDQDGGVTIQFGGDPAKASNCLSIVPGWNYMVRLYRPRAELLSGTWKFPEAQPVQ